MRIPRSVVVNNRRWKVLYRPLPGLDGQCLYRKQEIRIDSELPAEERPEVFLHELMHACLEEHGTWSARAEEIMVRRLAPRLLAALKDAGWIR